MNKKRAVFQIPPDMSPAETGNQMTCSDGLVIHIYTYCIIHNECTKYVPLILSSLC